MKLADIIPSGDKTRVWLCFFWLKAKVDVDSSSHWSLVCGVPHYIRPELVSPISQKRELLQRQEQRVAAASARKQYLLNNNKKIQQQR